MAHGTDLAAAMLTDAMELSAGRVSAQTVGKQAMDLPNPYAAVRNFGQLRGAPMGRRVAGRR